VIKTLEAQVGQFLLGCKCPVSHFLPGRAKDLSAPLYTLVLSCMALYNGEMYGRMCGGNVSYRCCKNKFMWRSVLLDSVCSKSWCESTALFGTLCWWVNVFSFSSKKHLLEEQSCFEIPSRDAEPRLRLQLLTSTM
jgi:hypothetical protein